MVTKPLAIQELGLQPRRGFGGLLQLVPVSAPALGGPDLSRYRGFQFGETLPAVAKQAGLDVSQAKVIHERPALLQELEWPIWLASSFDSPQDPVRTILFSFYNGELFRVLVSYDRDDTTGLTHRGRDRSDFGPVWNCHQAREHRNRLLFGASLQR